MNSHINDVIKPLFGALGIEAQAEELHFKYGKYEKVYYESVKRECLSHDGHKITCYLRLTDYGRLELKILRKQIL